MDRRASSFRLIALLALPAAFTLALLAPGTALSATILVDAAGGGDYMTIQPALTAASDGDTIMIAPGTYTGAENRNLSFGSNKNLVVEAESGFPTVTIDCEGVDRAFYIYHTHQDTTSIIRGLVIENGYTDDYNGGAMIISQSDLVVEDCLFENCVASHNGGAVSIGYTYLDGDGQGCRVYNCVFHGNTATYRGGGLMVDHASAYIKDCLFYDNSTTVNAHRSEGGGAIYLNSVDSDPDYRCVVARCTIVRNYSPGRGTGLMGWGSSNWTFMGDCIFAFNQGDSLGVFSDPMIDALTYSIAYGNEGGNIAPGYSTVLEEDPLFCGYYSDDFTLCANSPALPAVNIWGRLIGFADQGCGNCGPAVEQASWGRIKALYRADNE